MGTCPGGVAEQEPIPPKSIINVQKLEWGTCYCGYSGRVIPSWISSQINTELVQCGFTQQSLEQEMDKINDIAAQLVSSQNNSCRCYWWIGLVFAILVMIAGLLSILIIIPDYWFVLFGCVGFAILVFYIFNWGVTYYYLKIWNQCLQHIEQHINNQLNPVYSKQDILWNVRWKKVRHGCGRSSYWVKYMMIIVTPNAKYTPPQTNTEDDVTTVLINN